MLPDCDKEGFLCDLSNWNQAVAVDLAALEGIELTPAHWEVIELVRDFYATYKLFPANRVLIRRMKEQFHADKGSSIYLMKLFTGRPRRVLARVSGLPKPTHCD